MKQGTVISATGHAALIALAIFGLPEYRSDRQPALAQVTDVSIVSLEAFEAARSDAPQEAEVPPSTMAAPSADVTPDAPDPSDQVAIVPPLDGPDAPASEAAPDMSGVQVVQPDVATQVDLPTAQADAGPIGLDTPLIDAAPKDGSVNSTQTALLVPERPNLAPRIDTSAAAKPEEPVREAPEVVADSAPDPDTASEDPKPEEDAAAPKEATTENLPDAKPEERPTTPQAATRPKGRPVNLAAEAEAARKAEEKAIAAALAAAQAEVQTPEAPEAPETPTASGSRLGGNFNSAQRQAVGDAIGGKWNKQLIEGKEGYEDLVVIVRVKLTAAGKVIGDVEPVDPARPQGDFKVAYEAARRAVLMAARGGIPLPRDIFRDGDYLEIRFDPGRSAISLN